MRTATLATLLALIGCGTVYKVEDADGDGLTPLDGDCWDLAQGPEGSGLGGADIFPGAADVWYDGVDADCAGDDDYDADSDGFDLDADCDDADAEINPSSEEIWYDGLDQDCDGNDADQDGDGYVLTDDCDDTDATRYPDPDIEEVWYNGVDEDCDGNDGDQDGDGYVAADYAYDWTVFSAHLGEGDCWDDPAASSEGYETAAGPLSPDQVSPGEEEVWYDGADQDCDGADDFDQDGDGYRTANHDDLDGDPAGEDCYDSLDDDFEDGAGLGPVEVNPAASDAWYDGTDADCDGADDYDQDGDGYGAEGLGGSADDCDDTSKKVNPGEDERCSTAFDDDCDGDANDRNATGCTTFYADGDADGYGSGTNRCQCVVDSTYSTTVGGDCDDSNAAYNPGETEICDAADVDEDCDSLSNDDDPSAATSSMDTWYTDGDGDGYGDAAVMACEQPSGTVDDDADCDDDSDVTYPGALEVCGDGAVNDCDASEADAREICRLSGTVDLADADGSVEASNSGDALGAALAVGVDLSGDGHEDLLVGATGHGSGRGAVHIIGGGTVTLSLATLLRGDSAGDALGSAVDGAGDWDGDGYADMAAGSPAYDYRYSGEGGYYLVPGPVTSSTAVNSVAEVAALGSGKGYAVGSAVAGLGDADGDGLDDQLVGSPGDETGATAAGAVWLLLGGVTGSSKSNISDLSALVLYGEDASESAGAAVAGPGDVNGDGVADMLIGAPGACTSTATCPGAAYLLLDTTAGELTASDADATFVGQSASDEAGSAIGPAGDVDGDGYADFSVGAPGNDAAATSAGSVYLVLGAATPVSAGLKAADAIFGGVASGDEAGGAVGSAGDMDGDGLDDLVMSALGADAGGSESGTIYLVYAPVSGAMALSGADLVVVGEAASDQAGRLPSHAADLDEDGLLDLIVGAPGVDTSASSTDNGAVYGLLGTTY